jgi:hypothetical protein
MDEQPGCGHTCPLLLLVASDSSQAAQLEYDAGNGIWAKGDRKRKLNPKSITKFSSMPDDNSKKKAIYHRSVSAITSSHTSISNVATSGSTNLHTITSQDSFAEQLREENEDEESDVEDGEIDGEESTSFHRLPGGKTSLYLEGQIDKKSPAHNLWQERWFKLMTRVANEGLPDSYHGGLLMSRQMLSMRSPGPRREVHRLSRPSPLTPSLA